MPLMTRIISAGGNARLARRERLPVDPTRSIAVKRDVHEFVVATDPERFAAGFREVMTDPEGTFGLIRVKRPAERLGREFQAGERFQGCYSLGAALIGRRPGRARRALAWLLGTAPLRWLIGRIEDAMLSDYAIIDELVLEPGPGETRRLRYSYLEGTPIRGSSTFTIAPEGANACRVTQIFEYQEVNAIALASFQRMGLKMHDQVVHTQIHRAAARAGAAVLSGTIPGEYAEA